ncbi:RNA ligase family protein [Streptomyces sp. NPDC057575]|uniref:RNA ligase family protein n=1 Tax=unclassified Streptomyces TaxID=2593676 RepID=UPI00369115C6
MSRAAALARAGVEKHVGNKTRCPDTALPYMLAQRAAVTGSVLRPPQGGYPLLLGLYGGFVSTPPFRRQEGQHSMLRAIDLAALNTATKYPSIPTYHGLDPKNGGLIEDAAAFDGDVYLTEKVDGTNGRIVSFPGGDYVLGSREELLYARGDLIGNPALGIADALRPLADRVTPPTSGIRVLYLEVYGGKVTAASREYTGSRTVGYRLFDAADIPLDVLEQPRARISSWREDGGQQFLDEGELTRSATAEGIELVPRLATVRAGDLPNGIAEMQTFLAGHLPTSRVILDEGAGGHPEGIVLRNSDRSVIAKARFQDYRRTLGRRTRPARSR